MLTSRRRHLGIKRKLDKIPLTLFPTNKAETIRLLVTIGYMVPIIILTTIDLGFELRPEFLQWIRLPIMLPFYIGSTVYFEIENFYIAVASALFMYLMLI